MAKESCYRVQVMAKLLGTGAISSENMGNVNGLRSWVWAQSESLAITHRCIIETVGVGGSKFVCAQMMSCQSI